MAFLSRLLRSLPLLIVAPFMAFLSVIAIAVDDLIWAIAGRKKRPVDIRPHTGAASVVIPNWNGKDLLEKYLPSVVTALQNNPANEVIVVDNGSTDGSAEFLQQRFPEVRRLALPVNLGFGGGSNAGFRAAKNDIVVLLNSDMRVQPDFLAPLLSGFTDEKVFAVSCQIFLSDPKKRREETGLTQGWWQDGGLRVGHHADAEIRELYPCFYGGGGSCAFDPPQISRARRFRRLACSVLSGRHGPRLSGVEARLEGSVSTGERRFSRASRNDRAKFFRRPNSGGAEEKLRVILLEKYP